MTYQIKKLSVLSLAIPIMVELFLRSIIGTLSIYLLSDYSDAAAAGVGVANQVNNIIQMFCMAIAVGSAVALNRTIGAGDKEGSEKVCMNSLFIAIVFGMAVSIPLFLFARPFLALLGLQGEILDYSSVYLRITGCSAMFIGLSQILSYVFRSFGKAKISMLAITAANLVNLAGIYISVKRPELIPVSTITGVAVSKLVCEFLGAAILLVLMVAMKCGFNIRYLFRFDARIIKSILAVGASSSAESLSYNIGTLLTTGFIASSALGAAALSAKVYVGNLNYYEQIIGNSIGQASQIISGQKIGAREYESAQKFITKMWRYIAAFNVVSAGTIFLFSGKLMGLFTSDPVIIKLAIHLFMLEILINFARSFNHSFNFGNRSAGYVLWPAVVAVVSLWGIYVFGSYILCNAVGLGIIGVWIAMFLDESTRGASTCIMWVTGKWKKRFDTV